MSKRNIKGEGKVQVDLTSGVKVAKGVIRYRVKSEH